MDVASGIPVLPHMVMEGQEVPRATDLSRRLKARAAALIDAGPPPLDAEGERRRRYMLSALLDDLRGSQLTEEVMACGARLFEELADYARGTKTIGRRRARSAVLTAMVSTGDPAMGAGCSRLNSKAELPARAEKPSNQWIETNSDPRLRSSPIILRARTLFATSLRGHRRSSYRMVSQKTL